MKKIFRLAIVIGLMANSASMAIFGNQANKLFRVARPLSSYTKSVVTETTTNNKHKLALAATVAIGATAAGGLIYYKADNKPAILATPITPNDTIIEPSTTTVNPEPDIVQEIKAEQVMAQAETIPVDPATSLPKNFTASGNLKESPKVTREIVFKLRDLLATHDPKDVCYFLLNFSRKYILADLDETIPMLKKACRENSNKFNQKIKLDSSIAEQIQDSEEDESFCTECAQALKLLTDLRMQVQTVPFSRAKGPVVIKGLDQTNLRLEASFNEQINDQIADIEAILTALNRDAAERACTAKGNLFANISGVGNWFKSQPSCNLDPSSYIYNRNAAYLIDPITKFSKVAALEEVLVTYRDILNEVSRSNQIDADTARSILEKIKDNPYREFVSIRLYELSNL